MIFIHTGEPKYDKICGIHVEGKNMSIALDLPPVIKREVRYCANARGISFAQFLFELVGKESIRIRAERSRRTKPNACDFIGHGSKFDNTPITTAEHMAEMQENRSKMRTGRLI